MLISCNILSRYLFVYFVFRNLFFVAKSLCLLLLLLINRCFDACALTLDILWSSYFVAVVPSV